MAVAPEGISKLIASFEMPNVLNANWIDMRSGYDPISIVPPPTAIVPCR